MLPDESDASYLWDMREAAHDCVEFVRDVTYDQFCANKMIYSAVERRLEILGEAAGRVSEAFQAKPSRNILERDQRHSRHPRSPVWRR
jgi:uncharacterized protein with HEPN domain